MSLDLYKTNPDAIDLLRSLKELLANEHYKVIIILSKIIYFLCYFVTFF